MDYLTKKELNTLKNEIENSNAAVEAEKYSFERKLFNDIGPKMMEQLNNPKPVVEKKKDCFFKRIFKRKKSV